MDNKMCGGCEKTKPLSEYHYRTDSADERQPLCKPCITHYHSKGYTPKPDKRVGKWSDNYSNLKVIESILRKRLRNQFEREDFEDGIQQGLVRAWEDQKSGKYSEIHVINRAENWARAFYQKPWLPLGHTRKAGQQKGTFTQEQVDKRLKVRDFMDSYEKEHGKQPSNRQIADATGYDISWARRLRQDVANGRGLFRTSVDEEVKVETQYIEDFVQTTGYKYNDTWAELGSMEFESDTVSRVYFYEILGKLSAEHRQALHMRFFEGQEYETIGSTLCTGENPRQSGYRMVKRALSAAKKHL